MSEQLPNAADPKTKHPLTPDEANWEMVRKSLATMAQAQADLQSEIKEQFRVHGQLLVGRFDGVDSRLDAVNEKLAKQQQELDRYNKVLDLGLELLDHLNTIVAGIRSATDSNYDMTTSVARKIERVRKFLNVPDAVIAEAPPGAETGSSG